MTRNTFLATIAALFTAPFIGKKEISIPEADARWLNANPALLDADMEFIDCRPITAKEVARVFKVPEEYLRGGYTFSNQSSADCWASKSPGMITPNQLRKDEDWAQFTDYLRNDANP